MTQAVCRVCASPVEPIYRSVTDVALNSSATVLRAHTNVDLCLACEHVQTQPISDLTTYYSSEYNFRAGSPEEDDLCMAGGATPAFRSDIQAAIVEAKLDLDRVQNVLDFGSGKARTLRLLAERHPAIRPHAFDVSDVYREFWNEFIAPDAQASFEIPPAWRANFDVVLSFFALEHVERPAEFVATLRSLLRPGGRAVVVLPNMYQNASDFIVVDHVNHFSESSLLRLFREGGFAGATVDAKAQVGWYVVDAQLEQGAKAATQSVTRSGEANDLAEFWRTLADRVREAETQRADRRAAIYGSGVYGLFVASALRDPERIACFLDRNPFRQGLSFFGAPVVAPEAVPADVDFVYVGLNPLSARAAIAAVPALAARELFFV